jgi:hypothetical protein
MGVSSPTLNITGTISGKMPSVCVMTPTCRPSTVIDPTSTSAPLDEAHAIPIPFLVSIFKLGIHDRIAKQFPIFQGVRDIEGDPILVHPADQAKDRVPD